jgi:hypothetical protein
MLAGCGPIRQSANIATDRWQRAFITFLHMMQISD